MMDGCEHLNHTIYLPVQNHDRSVAIILFLPIAKARERGRWRRLGGAAGMIEPPIFRKSDGFMVHFHLTTPRQTLKT